MERERREELLQGSVTAPKLVARESLPTFQQKRETRRMTPAERYDLKVLSKNGEKRPVELSVRRIVLANRDSGRREAAHESREWDTTSPRGDRRSRTDEPGSEGGW